MAADVLDHAFEPFFTTKIVGQGTGLGLSPVFGFVTQSNGIVQLQSKVGRGTSVHLFLPMFSEIETREKTDDSTPKRDVPVSASVLLVEDETSVRSLAAEALRDAGCTVREVGDAAAALALLRGRPPGSGANIDILVTDVGLPGGLYGRQLADAVREIMPNLPVLLVTGYAGDAVESHGLVRKMALLRKPFELNALVHEVLDMTR